MGGKQLKLERQLSVLELQDVDKILRENDYAKRKTLIAVIIRGVADGSDNLELAQNIVQSFSFSQSKNPIEASRATIFRVIRDLNSGMLCSEVLKKRGNGNVELEKWNERKIQDLLCELHDDLKDNFSYVSVKNRNPSLVSIIENKMRFQDALRLSGINPTVHLNDFDWGDEQQSKIFLKSFLNDIKLRCGIDSLNYHSMYSYQSSIIGVSKDAHEKFDACRKYGCIRRLSGSAIIRKIEGIFGNYKDGIIDLLGITESQYSTQIEKKRQSIDLDEYLSEFNKFINSSDGNWTVANFAKMRRSTHHGIHNKKSELTFLAECDDDAMVAAYVEIKFRNSNLTEAEYKESQLYEHVVDAKSRRVTNPQTRLEGYNFQSLFLEMIESSSAGLKRDVDFYYEKEIDRKTCHMLGHTKTCKVDFKFKNLIIDTKRTLRKTSKINEQLRRYHDHCHNLLIVTMRQNFDYIIDDNISVPVITVFDFIHQSEKYIASSISLDWIKVFETYGREASARIKTHQQ